MLAIRPHLHPSIFGVGITVQWSGVGVAGACVLWGGVLLFGTRTLLNYESTPGVPSTPLSRWPSESRVPRHMGEFTLVMLAHPNCPCTRASLAELEIVMTELQGRLAAFVLFGRSGERA